MIRSSQSVRVCVLAGGDSAERAVSLASGQDVAAALVAAGYQVTCIDPQPSEGLPTSCPEQRDARRSPGEYEFRPALWHQIAWRGFDACFLALHGGAGEDGRLQEYLEQRGVRFTGPLSHAARAAMSKTASKKQFRATGIPTPDYWEFGEDTPLAEISRAAESIGYPLVAKADAQGSSLGVALVESAPQLAAGVRQVLDFGTAGLLEQFVPGREFTVAVLGREPLPLLEVCAGRIFSYAEKYDLSRPHYCRNADLPPEQQRAIAKAAVDAARTLDTQGLVRIDLRLDDAGQPWVLELNALPGMTASSLAPAAAREAGLGMPELCDRILRECLERGTCP